MIYDKMMYDLYKEKDLKINEDLYYNNRSDDLVKYIIDVLKAYERIPNITLTGWDHVTDESEIEPYLVNQKYAKSKIKYKKFIPIDDTRYELLIVHFDVETDVRVLNYDIKLLLPKRYKKFYFLLNGNKFYPIYQLIEASTFSRKNSIILRPMNIYREVIDLYDTTGEIHSLVRYNLLIFGKKLNPLLLYVTIMGIDNMLKYFFLNDIIEINMEHDLDMNDTENKCYFKTKPGIVISIYKYFLEKDKFIQSVITNLILIFNESKIEDFDLLNERDLWAEQLGGYFTTSKEEDKKIRKAKEIINSFYAIATDLYKSNLKLNTINKDNTFAILRWIMQNFTQLRLKDSLDLKNKRIRLGEYIGDYFSQVVQNKLNRFLSNSSQQIATKELKYLFQYQQNIIIKKLMYTKTPLLRYDNSVNDMDFFTAFKYSVKGPSSLNGKGRTPISLMSIHQSQVGKVDITSSSSSDPGVTGYFTPFCKTIDGKFFDNTEEPQTWMGRFSKMYSNYFNGTQYSVDSLDDYEDVIKNNRKFLKKMHNVQSFVENYTGSNKKLKIVDLRLSKKNKIALLEAEKNKEPKVKRLFKNKPRKLFKNKDLIKDMKK